MVRTREIKGGKMDWGPKGRKEESNTLPSVRRGRKGKEGEETMIYCPYCHCYTTHVLKQICNPHPRAMWICKNCAKHKVPGRFIK